MNQRPVSMSTDSGYSRIAVNPRVHLPSGELIRRADHLVQYSEPIIRRPRSRKYQQNAPADITHIGHMLKLALHNGIHARTLLWSALFFMFILSIILCLQFGDALVAKKAVDSIHYEVETATRENKVLADELKRKTSSTGIQYAASQTLGLIAAKGAETIYIEVPVIKTLVDNPQPLQSGAYAALQQYGE